MRCGNRWLSFVGCMALYACGQLPRAVSLERNISYTPIEKETDRQLSKQLAGTQDFAIVHTDAKAGDGAPTCLQYQEGGVLSFADCTHQNAQQFSWGNKGQIRIFDIGCLNLNLKDNSSTVNVATCSDFARSQRWVIRYGNIRNEAAASNPNQSFCLSRASDNTLTIQDCQMAVDREAFQLIGSVVEQKGFLIRSSERNDKCLSAGTVPAIPYQGAPIVIRTCESSIDQAWQLVQGQLRLGDKCLGILGDLVLGASLGIVPCRIDGLLWDMDGGRLRIVSAGSEQPSDFCADIWDGIYQDGNKIGVYWCTDNNSHQQWRLGR